VERAQRDKLKGIVRKATDAVPDDDDEEDEKGVDRILECSGNESHGSRCKFTETCSNMCCALDTHSMLFILWLLLPNSLKRWKKVGSQTKRKKPLWTLWL